LRLIAICRGGFAFRRSAFATDGSVVPVPSALGKLRGLAVCLDRCLVVGSDNLYVVGLLVCVARASARVLVSIGQLRFWSGTPLMLRYSGELDDKVSGPPADHSRAILG
jgi:hypothetical protein